MEDSTLWNPMISKRVLSWMNGFDPLLCCWSFFRHHFNEWKLNPILSRFVPFCNCLKLSKFARRWFCNWRGTRLSPARYSFLKYTLWHIDKNLAELKAEIFLKLLHCAVSFVIEPPFVLLIFKQFNPWHAYTWKNDRFHHLCKYQKCYRSMETWYEIATFKQEYFLYCSVVEWKSRDYWSSFINCIVTGFQNPPYAARCSSDMVWYLVCPKNHGKWAGIVEFVIGIWSLLIHHGHVAPLS